MGRSPERGERRAERTYGCRHPLLEGHRSLITGRARNHRTLSQTLGGFAEGLGLGISEAGVRPTFAFSEMAVSRLFDVWIAPAMDATRTPYRQSDLEEEDVDEENDKRDGDVDDEDVDVCLEISIEDLR